MSACCRGSSTRLIHSRLPFLTHAGRETATSPANRLRGNICISPSLRLCRSYATATQPPAEVATPFPPPSFGTIRQRLSHWQDQYGDRVAQIIRDYQAEDPANAFINEFQTEVDFGRSDEQRLAEYWEVLGEPGANLRRRMVEPGHLVEIAAKYSSQDPELAVCIRLRGPYTDVLTIRGRWVACRSMQLHWALPGFLDKDMLKPLLKYSPSDLPEQFTDQPQFFDVEIPRHISGPITSELSRFKNQALDVYRRHAVALDNAHAILAHKTELRFGTLEAIAGKLLGQGEVLSSAAIYAVLKAVVRQPVHFGEFVGSGRRGGLFRIRPQEQIALISLVSNWLRQYRDGLAVDPEDDVYESSRLRSREGYRHFDYFVNHARTLISQSRKSRSLTANGLSPSHQQHSRVHAAHRANGQFRPQESLIIRYLELWCVQRAFSQDPGLFGLPTLVLKSVGMYDELAPNLQTGLLFLQELGVIPPHTSKWVFSEELLLPCSEASKSLEAAYSKVHNEEEPPSLRDSLEHYRHDWGNLRVICIDPPDSQEADDGISLEDIPGQPGIYWLRVHIANPSAFLRRDSLISDLAQQLTSKYYFPDVQFPMLPDYLTELCSIKPGVTPVLTISVKVDLEGSILDKDVRSAVIRNVTNTTYENVNRQLGIPINPVSLFTVGAGNPKEASTSDSESAALSREDVQTLSKILKVTSAFERRRIELSSPDPLFRGDGMSRLSVWDRESFLGGDSSRLKTFLLPNRRMSCDFQGDPVIQLATKSYMPRIQAAARNERYNSSHNLVAEAMVMANIALAEWSWERKIPLLYRGSLLRKPMSEIDALRQKGRQQAMSMDDSQFWEKISLMQREGREVGGAFCSSRPTILPRLGVHSYVKGTSPLRRFGDLVTHWQVQAALEYEATTGKILTAMDPKEPRGFLPFSKQDIDKMLLRVANGEHIVASFQGLIEWHWYSEFFRRAIYHEECKLPDTIRILILNSPDVMYAPQTAGPDARLVPAWMLDHSLPISISESDPLVKTHGVEHYDVWEARISRIVPGSQVVVADLLRLESRREASFLQEYKRWKLYSQSAECYVAPFSDESSWGLKA